MLYLLICPWDRGKQYCYAVFSSLEFSHLPRQSLCTAKPPNHSTQNPSPALLLIPSSPIRRRRSGALDPPQLLSMAAAARKADTFLLLLLLLSFHLVSSLTGEDPVAALLDRQAAQLDRLEALVESLTRTVSALADRLAPRSASSEAVPVVPGAKANGGGEGAGQRVAVTKPKPLWSERFQFAAAAQLESEAACVAVLPYEDLDGLSKYFAVGDTRGRVYIFSSAGDVVMELPSLSDSPVTSMLAYLSFSKNESFLFTGHADGTITAHSLWESAASGDEWLTLTLGSSRPFVRGGRELDSPPVMGLEVHQVGRTRYVLASDSGGRIRVFTENGTLYGTAIASNQPLAFMKSRLLFLTETGAGSLDLRTMAVRETECDGLNGSVVKRYSFDGTEQTKVYGFTAEGDLIHVILLGDIANLKCRVRSIRKAEVQSAVSIQTIKGYLLIVSLDKVFVYNISSQYFGRVGAPRPLFIATLQEIKSQFLSSETLADGFSAGKPLIAVDREKLVVLGLGGGYIGIYRTNFPVFKVESNAVVWSAPALLFLLFLIGIWQFYVKKKDTLGWTHDEAFSVPSNTSGSLLGPPPGDRAYGDAPRAADLREMRGNALRGSSRRYVSPSRYPGAPGIPFRPSSADPGFRATADLKYRGQSVETAGIPKRREPLFQNNQVVEDQSD